MAIPLGFLKVKWDEEGEVLCTEQAPQGQPLLFWVFKLFSLPQIPFYFFKEEEMYCTYHIFTFSILLSPSLMLQESFYI